MLITHALGGFWVCAPRSIHPLAIAPNSLVFSNVGNKIAVFVLQSLGCEVSALNTVQFSELKLSLKVT